MKILVELRKGDYYVEQIEEYDTDSYLEAIKMALDKHSKAGYAVSKVKNMTTSLVEESDFDPRN